MIHVPTQNAGNLTPAAVSQNHSAAAKWHFIIILAATIFLGAFLLFQVQPLIGKYILPWFGGSPEVWTTCMLFFQVILLAGYAYAHFSITRLSPRTQGMVYMILLAAALLTLPITPSSAWKPHTSDWPVAQILLLIAACIGLPYFVLSAAGPLLQGWLTRTNPRIYPYPFYALSNTASLLALVSYPFVIEPVISRQNQTILWSILMAVFALLALACTVYLWRHPASRLSSAGGENPSGSANLSPSWSSRGLWLALAGCACLELLAITNKICQDIAAIPFLWIVPLSIYLLSFIICFHHPRWYIRPLWLGVFILSIAAVTLARGFEDDITAEQKILLYSALLLSCCMVCHGELYRLRPDPRHLTDYYLTIAAGGALGGFFVAVLAPVIFRSYAELYWGLLACCFTVLLAHRKSFHPSRRIWAWIIFAAIIAAAALVVQTQTGNDRERVVNRWRNFFGVLTLLEMDRRDPAQHHFVLQHGSTIHGLQFVQPDKLLIPTTYYGPDSGGGLALRYFLRPAGRRIGIIGLGVGTLAVYAGENDYLRFYEINPQVQQLAQTRFSFLDQCPAKKDIIIGDARLSLERQPPQQFDILILDAFTGDAVPVHLLTKEAFEIYLAHLKPDGVIALHLSSVYLDLKPVVWKLAQHFLLPAAWIENDEDQARGVYASNWILLTRNSDFLQLAPIQHAARKPNDSHYRMPLWTDDHVSLLPILK